jgi:hypothetical protein
LTGAAVGIALQSARINFSAEKGKAASIAIEVFAPQAGPNHMLY